MANLREIRRRIKSVQSICDITKAMEIISAVRYKKIDTRFKKSLSYSENLARLMSRFMTEERVAGHPLFEERPIRKELVVLVTGDRGLCGSFHSQLFKEYFRYAGSVKHDLAVYVVGKVGTTFAQRRGLKIHRSITGIGFEFTASALAEKTEELIRLFTSGQYDRISVLCTDLSRSGSQKPVMEPFFGLNYLFAAAGKGETESAYLVEPEPKSVVAALVELFVRQRFYTLLLRSVTAEFLARMLAMKQASDNGKEMVDELTLERNKVRQAMITRELSEIIGGVNALA